MEKKVRGHKRRWKQIHLWVEQNRRLTPWILEEYGRDHIDIVVHPWCDISITNSKIPEPKGETKLRLLAGLLEIYEAWKAQLDETGEPYYLKLWLYEPHFSNSQVVCAMGDQLHFYDRTFHKPEETRSFQPGNYGRLADQLSEFDWEFCWDEEHLDDGYLAPAEMYTSRTEFEADRRWFNRQLKKPHRVTKLKEPVGDITEVYSFKKGTVWVGGK